MANASSSRRQQAARSALDRILTWSRVPSAVRSVHQLDTPEGSIGRVLMIFGFAALMAYFGISSFWKARKISRS